MIEKTEAYRVNGILYLTKEDAMKADITSKIFKKWRGDSMAYFGPPDIRFVIDCLVDMGFDPFTLKT